MKLKAPRRSRRRVLADTITLQTSVASSSINVLIASPFSSSSNSYSTSVIFLSHTIMEAPQATPVPASAALRECQLCDLKFDTAEEKREHAKSEWQ
jgi:hypothetical protein